MHIKHFDTESRLEALALLKDGWLNGEGRALDSASLVRLAKIFDKSFSRSLPQPYFYPTLEGGVRAEWTLGDWEVSLDIALPSLVAHYQAVNTVTEETSDQIMYLTSENGIGWLTLNEELTKLMVPDCHNPENCYNRV